MRRFGPLALAAALACLWPGGAVAADTTTPTPEQIELFKQLPPDQQQRLMEQYGLDATQLETGAPPTRDVSSPELVQPRTPVFGDSTAMQMPDSALVAQGPAASAMPGEKLHFAAEDVEVRQAFSNFLEEGAPLAVNTELQPFGYDLFAGSPTTFAPATDVPVGPDYVIGPGDEIHVQLYGKTSLSVDLTVDRDGLIAFPELGPIAVAGQSFAELRESLLREVDKRMIGVEASITLGRLRSIRIFALGEVFRPGSYTVSGLSTLTNALFAAGGVKEIGSLRRIQLKREGQLVSTLDLYDLLMKGDTSGDARLLPGDVIFVPPVGPRVGVAGEVKRPARYELVGKVTATEILDLAGGLTARAYTPLLQLDRYQGDRRVSEDFPLAEAGKWSLRDGDLLKVFPVTGQEEGVVWLDGNVRRPGKRQFARGMRLLDLVGNIDDLLPETHFAYGLIERESPVNRETEYLAFDLGAALLDGDATANIALQDRDKVFVFHRAYFREQPKVKVRGRVQEQGEYAFRKDMHVMDLILAAGGLLRDSWLQEAELFRTDPLTLDVTKIPLDLRRVMDADPRQNIALQDLDDLMVHSIWEFKDPQRVEILGEINYPGVYPRFEGMRVSDLIFAGGSLREEAFRERAELTRYAIIDGERRELQHVSLDLRSILAGEPEADVFLKPYDRVLIRRISNWRTDEVVKVEGEVTFPGSYPIEEGERLSGLIERFGGFLERAYLPAVVFTREDVRLLQQEQFDRMADQLEADLARMAIQVTPRENTQESTKRQVALESGQRLATALRTAQATGRLVIHLSDLEKQSGSDWDLVLKDGDRLIVPKKPNYVMVIGEVHNPTAFQFHDDMKAKDLVKQAGGETRFADTKRAYVVRADGSVTRGLGTRMNPGDVVVVPETLERFSGMQFMLDVSQVLYQLGLAAASAKTVGAF
ncbi:MAG: SLBB domain-containing protein [Candidatus Latescibacteria bacterium]|nr:SLBB domain-containing protein [Candidatus Latescibacterota bacterium]